MSTNQVKQNIRLQIVETQRDKFYLEDIDDKDAESLGQDDIEINVELGIGSNIELQQLKVLVDIDVVIIENKKSLFGISSGTVFYSPDFKKLVDKDSKIIAPEDFIRKLMNISIGGTRGMLSILLSNSGISHLTLPLLDLSDFKNHKKD